MGVRGRGEWIGLGGGGLEMGVWGEGGRGYFEYFQPASLGEIHKKPKIQQKKTKKIDPYIGDVTYPLYGDMVGIQGI